MVARTVLLVVVLLAAVGLFMFGVPALIAGIAEQHAANNTYVVTIATSGDDCGANQVSFDAGGNVLTCESPGMYSTDPVAHFAGFTDAQDQRITDLAHKLGAANELSGAGLAQLQQQVDKIAATVPDAKKPHYDEGVSLGPLWGAWLAVTGGAALVLGVLSIWLGPKYLGQK